MEKEGVTCQIEEGVKRSEKKISNQNHGLLEIVLFERSVNILLCSTDVARREIFVAS